MSNYSGNNVGHVIPKLNQPRSFELSEEEVNSWWETLSTRGSQDPLVGRNPDTDRDAFYYLGNDGKLTAAIGPEEDLNSLETRRRLMEQSLNGRLMSQELGGAFVRQVITNDTSPYDVGYSDYFRYSQFVWQPELPAEPAKPNFFKRVLNAIFNAFQEEIDAYNADKAAYDLLAQEAQLLYDFGDLNGEKLTTTRDAELTNGKTKEAIAAKEREIARINAEKNAPQLEQEAAERKAKEISDNAKEGRREVMRQQKARGELHRNVNDRFARSLGDPEAAKRTQYSSYEAALDAMDAGKSLMSRGTEDAWSKASEGNLAESYANILRVNNQRINRYTVDQPQFAWIARVNQTILQELVMKPELREKSGLTEEELRLARGVVVADYIYNGGQQDGLTLFDRLADGKNIAPNSRVAASVMLGEIVSHAVDAHKGQDEPNPMFLRLGEAYVPGSKGYREIRENMRDSLRNSPSFRAYMTGVSIEENVARFRNRKELGEQGMKLLPEELQHSFGLDYVPPKKEDIMETIEESIEEGIGVEQTKVEQPEVEQTKVKQPEEKQPEEKKPEEKKLEEPKHEEPHPEQTIQKLKQDAETEMGQNGAVRDHATAMGYSKANSIYVESKYARLNMIEDIQKDRNAKLRESKLGDILLGEMLNRSVNGPDVTTEEAAKFLKEYNNMHLRKQNPENKWKKQLLATPAARELLNADKETMLSTLTSSARLSVVVNNAIAQTNEKKVTKEERNTNEPQKQGPEKKEEKSGPSMGQNK